MSNHIINNLFELFSIYDITPHTSYYFLYQFYIFTYCVFCSHFFLFLSKKNTASSPKITKSKL